MPTLFEADQLLERFAPTLVIFPEDRNKVPYDPDRILDVEEYGDYHPRQAEVALDNSRIYADGRPFQEPGEARRGRPSRFETYNDWLRDMVGRAVDLGSTALNLIGVEVDRPVTAWDQFFTLTRKLGPDGTSRYPVSMYGRIVTASDVDLPEERPAGMDFEPSDVALQYWLFYYYNDFRNLHEMDWEMVTVVVRPDGDDWTPRWVGVTAHTAGTRLPWASVSRSPANGDSAIVFVAAGSHAQYLRYEPAGYRTIVRSVRRSRWLSRILSFLMKLPILKNLVETMVDIIPPNEERFYLNPAVARMPDTPGRDDPDWWWMNYEGLWGERPDTFIDLEGTDYTLLTKGPVGPWLQGDEWSNPFQWLCQLAEGRTDAR